MREKYLKYKNKYLKYKNKYLNLKKNLQNQQLTGGGSKPYLNETNLNTFEKKLKELHAGDISVILVVLYAPWCQFCHNFLDGEPYKNLVNAYAEEDEVEIVAIDCDVEEKDKQKKQEIETKQKEIFSTYLNNYEIMGFPTIMKITNESINEFSDDRENVEDLKTFVGEY